jgi:AGCS family alanine or glycine:cation symporter
MSFFSGLNIVEDVAWLYVGIPVLMAYGLYLSYKSNFLQIFKLPAIFNNFCALLYSKEKANSEKNERGINPLHVFFAAAGGCIGVGNVIGVCSAVKIGGPGAVFWMWIAAVCGMLVKYAEIFLSVKFRENDGDNDYVGGPILFLKKIGGGRYFSKIAAFLLCLYGVEVYLFKIVSYSVSTNWGINYTLVVAVLLVMIWGAIQGGLRLVGKVSSVLIPIFLLLFASMSTWVFIKNWAALPGVFLLIFKSAFSYHAAIGGFAGSSMWLAMSHGVRRACYTGDIGIGYAGTIHASTSEKNPAREAIFGVMSIVLDTLVICTISVLLILVTGTWNAGIHEEQMVVAALSQYFPYINLVWPLFIFLLGYSTLIAFFTTGRKAAQMLFSQKYGTTIYTVLGSLAFLFFSYIGKEEHCLMAMSLTGVSLLIINLYGMWQLSDHITYDFKSKK